MKSKNDVHLIGRAGRDAETKYTPSGKAVTNFSLATGGGTKNGKKVDPDWHSIKAWNSELAQSVEKGMQIEVKGFLSYEKWTDKVTGQPREKAVVVAQEVSLVVGDGEESPRQPSQQRQSEEYDDSTMPF